MFHVKQDETSSNKGQANFRICTHIQKTLWQEFSACRDLNEQMRSKVLQHWTKSKVQRTKRVDVHFTRVAEICLPEGDTSILLHFTDCVAQCYKFGNA